MKIAISTHVFGTCVEQIPILRAASASHLLFFVFEIDHRLIQPSPVDAGLFCEKFDEVFPCCVFCFAAKARQVCFAAIGNAVHDNDAFAARGDLLVVRYDLSKRGAEMLFVKFGELSRHRSVSGAPECLRDFSQSVHQPLRRLEKDDSPRFV